MGIYSELMWIHFTFQQLSNDFDDNFVESKPDFVNLSNDYFPDLNHFSFLIIFLVILSIRVNFSLTS
jgi:hypothetical protein